MRMVKNNNKSNQQKSNFARLQRETSRNFLVTYFMKEISCVILITFFIHCHSFSPLATSISHFLNATSNFSCCPSTKNVSFVFHLSLQLSFTLFLIELHWTIKAYMYFLFFSVFLLFCIPNCGHDNNINLGLTLLDNTDTVVSAS